MKLFGIRSLCVFTGLVLVVTSFVARADDDEKYDTLDGTGASGKTVNVIEWENNLEIHVYPKGSIKGLSFKLDTKNKQKPVMVIGYRFDNSPKKQIIRRAILGIPLKEGFHTYRDLSADDYDKVIISNNVFQPSKEIVAYNADPEPTQLYPDGHPGNDVQQAKPEPKRAVASTKEDKIEAHIANPALDEGSITPFKW